MKNDVDPDQVEEWLLLKQIAEIVDPKWWSRQNEWLRTTPAGEFVNGYPENVLEAARRDYAKR